MDQLYGGCSNGSVGIFDDSRLHRIQVDADDQRIEAALLPTSLALRLLCHWGLRTLRRRVQSRA